MAKKRTLTGEDRARAQQLRSEGMPASWIAEDLDCRRESLFRSGVTANPADADTWRSIWATIRRNEPLYALHKEFQPAEQYRV